MESVLHGAFGRVSLGMQNMTIGRAADNHIVIDDDNAIAYHAYIRHETTGYSITDLGAPNGTWLNGMRLKSYVPYTLRHFDTIRIGDASFVYEVVMLSPSLASAGLQYLPTQPEVPYHVVRQSFKAFTGALFKNRPRVLRRPLVVVLLIVSVGLVLLAGLSSTIFTWEQQLPPARILYTYCEALKSQDYATAYAQLDSDSQHMLKLSDFTHIIQHPTNMGTTRDCHVTTVSNKGNSAWGGINYTRNNGTVFTVSYNLHEQDHSWKISHLAGSSPDLLLAIYCHAIDTMAYSVAYQLWSKTTQYEIALPAFAHRLRSIGIKGCSTASVEINGVRATTTLVYTGDHTQERLYFIDLVYDDGFWWIDHQNSLTAT